MDLGLKDKVVLITGSSRGIGRATAAAFLAEGAEVILTGRSQERLAQVVLELQRLSPTAARAHCFSGDLTQPSVRQELFEWIESTLGGRLDVLVNNLGGSAGGGIDQTTDEEWERTFQLNFWSALDLTRRALPLLRRRGGGAIIFIASIWGRESGGKLAYNAAKAATISLSKNLARELAAENIRVNCVAPGSILFPGGSWDERRRQDPEGIERFVRSEIPSGRFGRPEEVADCVVFLASERASWVRGACLPVDGAQGRSNI
ncbi:MAG: SDR family oxidoreductase [Limnochordales bacterium]|nr:SDR family oxidoreductase [Limnochordales bacterium]